IIRDAVKKWGENADAGKTKVKTPDRVKWSLELSDDEKKATFCLAYALAIADDEVCQSEMDVLHDYINAQKGKTDYAFVKGIDMDLEDSIKKVESSKYKKEIVDLLGKVMKADGRVTADEQSLFDEITGKLQSGKELRKTNKKSRSKS
ncbi:MAG: hypothetical protein PHQ23_05590, partial [Candidatus Wallbacteria bacterium]|nr:hypothetical protein [Candidatus Wallbacteria bacterium]